MPTNFKLDKIDFPYRFELDDNGFIWLLDYDLKNSKMNLGQITGVQNLDNAKENALEMIYSMNLIEREK